MGTDGDQRWPAARRGDEDLRVDGGDGDPAARNVNGGEAEGAVVTAVPSVALARAAVARSAGEGLPEPKQGKAPGKAVAALGMRRARAILVRTDCVSVLSEARAPTLNTALERAALQQFVLARAAATSNEVEINRLKRKVTTLQTALNDSNERSIRLEEETLVERRARAVADEALRTARQDSDALCSSAQEVEAECVVLRAEVERLRQAVAASSAQLVELQGALNQAMAQKSSLMLQVAEVSATAAGLEAAEKKNSSMVERTLEALQGTLEYFGTMCPSSSAVTHEPLDRKLKRIQVASSLMMNSSVRYREISGQCAGIGVLRHLESL
ncbi:hypothetical protein GUJ93_ZPchr0015g6715 [Zizania palustris]|uniref:Uncharacterized protein n=1 Tax=Zizania palustris TaxID=103762 RepID=A0A8J5TI71_ZIZPA|nr:hypothetical protein GUJ93_ZPchr0015g6715 [Zizania palustris]